MGTRLIVLIDHDSIERHNLNRQVLPDPRVGRETYKSGALAEIIMRLRPDCRVRHYEQKLIVEDTELYKKYDKSSTVVYCCTDNDESRRATEKVFCNSRVIQLSAEGERDFWAIENYSRRVISTRLDTGDRDAYAAVPQWLVPNLLAAVQGIVMSRYPQARISLETFETPETMGYKIAYFFDKFMRMEWPFDENGRFPGINSRERAYAMRNGMTDMEYIGRYILANRFDARKRQNIRRERRDRARRRQILIDSCRFGNLIGFLDGEPVSVPTMLMW